MELSSPLAVDHRMGPGCRGNVVGIVEGTVNYNMTWSLVSVR